MASGDEGTDNAAGTPGPGADGKSFVDALAPGTIIHQSYRITEFAGEGGAGAVYVAEHISLGHLVAIKTLFGKFVRDNGMRRRFLEEAIIQANLRHPNIVSVSDVLDEPPLCAIFMEYIDGSSLDKHLAALGEPDDVTETTVLFTFILDAMTYAHSQGVVHRDIKPANILLARSGSGVTPKVTDFGIAKVLSDHQRTETGTAMGTVYYASPEQLTDAKSVDHRADVYSLGCTLYEMLTLKLPFVDSTMFGVMKKHLQAPRPDPARLNPLIPREISAAVMRAMAVDPKHRFQSCAEFANELRRALGVSSPAVSGASPRPSSPNTPATASAAAARPFSVSAGVENPVLVRTPHATSLPSSPPSTQASISQSTPTSIRRSRAGITHDSSTSVFIDPPRETNAVGRTLWVLIVILVLGLTVVIVGAMRAEPEKPPGSGNLIGATEDVGSTPAIDDAAVAAPPTTADEDTTPAREQLALPQCNALADRYVGFDAETDELRIALASLSEHVEHCTSLFESSSNGNHFDETVGFVSASQFRALHGRLQAIDARGGVEACPHGSTATGEIHRGLRRINTTSRDLPPIEARSLAHRRDVLSGIYVDVVTDLSDCTLQPVPSSLLSDRAVAELAAIEQARLDAEQEAERLALEQAAAEGSADEAPEE